MPLHKSKAGKIYKKNYDKLKNTNNLSKKIVRLPLHNHLSFKDIDYVCEKIKKYFNN